MNRRQLLRGALLGTVALAVPGPLLAQNTTGRTVRFQKGMDALWALLPEDRAMVGEKRAKLMEKTANRAWNIGTYQGLTPAKKNGLLTKGLRVLSRSAGRGGLLRTLGTAALIAGIEWALSDGSVVTKPNETEYERKQRECRNAGNYPLLPGQISMVNTGMYRNSNGNIIAYSKQAVPGWTGGTVPAPSGWSWAYQTSALGVTQVWFSRQVTTDNCKDFTWPRVPMPELPDLTGPDQPLPDDVKRKLPDVIIETGPVITTPKPDNQEEPDNKTRPKPPFESPLPDTITTTDLSTPWDEVFGTDPWFEFDPAVNTDPDPNTQPTPTPTSSPTPGTGTGTDGGTGSSPYPPGEEVEPESGGELPTFDKFSGPFRTLFDPFGAAFGGTGTCGPVPVLFQYNTISSTGTWNICPAIQPIAGGISLMSAGLGAYTCIDNILDA